MNFGGGWPGSTSNALADMFVGHMQSYTEGSNNVGNGELAGAWL